MNANTKRLIPGTCLLSTVAVLGLTFGMTPQASAQSNVTIYGAVSQALTKSSGKTVALDTPSFGSYIGFKGVEDLGGGLSAYFDMRNNFLADTGAQNGDVLWGEKSFVGLQGGFGKVQFGRFLNAYDDISFKAIGDSVAAQHGVGYSGRDDNTIGYYSPNFNGLTFTLTTSLKEGKDTNSNVSSVNVKYVNGPLVVALAHEHAEKKVGTMHNTTLIGGSYDFGSVKLLSDYAKASNGSDESNFRIGVAVPVGAGSLKAAFTKGKNAPDGFDRQFGLGYWHNLSKRTFLFTDVNSTKNSITGTTTSFDVGINHSF